MQVVSGLVKYIPEEQMQMRRCVLVCNLKPANMRGVKSHAMLLAATSPDGLRVRIMVFITITTTIIIIVITIMTTLIMMITIITMIKILIVIITITVMVAY